MDPLLQEAAWIFRQMWTHMSVKRIVGKDNKEVDVASWLTHLPVSYFTLHFNTFFPQKNPIDYYYPQGEDITGAVQHIC